MCIYIYYIVASWCTIRRYVNLDDRVFHEERRVSWNAKSARLVRFRISSMKGNVNACTHTHTHVQQFFQGKTRHLFVITSAFVCDKRRQLISATERTQDVSIFKAERNSLWHRTIGTWSRTAAQHRLESFQFSRAHIRKTLLACLDRSFLSFIVCTRLRR